MSKLTDLGKVTVETRAFAPSPAEFDFYLSCKSDPDPGDYVP